MLRLFSAVSAPPSTVCVARLSSFTRLTSTPFSAAASSQSDNDSTQVDPGVFIARVAAAFKRASDTITNDLQNDGFAVVDNFLASENDDDDGKDNGEHGCVTIDILRAEAVSLRAAGAFTTSQSTRYNARTGRVEDYEKQGVEATALDGGAQC
jgi:hypothetical protein